MSTLWVDPETVAAEWPDAVMDANALERLIAAAQDVLEHYAPALPDGAPIPERYQEALLLHIREVWRASEREGDVLGLGEFAVRARDMTSTVKALLRPRPGKPRLR